MNDGFWDYEKESLKLGLFRCEDHVSSSFLHETHFSVNQDKGQGWGKMLQINSGLYVGLSSYQLKERPEPFVYRLMAPAQFTILLSGHFELQLPGQSRKTVGPGDVWFGHRPEEEMICSQSHNDNICGVSIGLPEKFIETWLGNYSDKMVNNLDRLISGKSGDRHSFFPLAEEVGSSTRLMQIARGVLLTEYQTIWGKLHFESLVLELLAQLLTLESAQTFATAREYPRNRPAVEMAVEILRQEWASPPTVSSLARRVGTNECYLKKDFRSQTGKTVGEYIRELRMNKALELLTTGRYSILEIASAVGYSNPSQFSAAFKKLYGEPPSYYVPYL